MCSPIQHLFGILTRPGEPDLRTAASGWLPSLKFSKPVHFSAFQTEQTDTRKVRITAFLPKFSSTITTMSYRKKCFNVLMNEGGNVLPVQNVSQPAVLTINMHLVPFVPSRVCHVLWNKASDMPDLNASKRLMSLLFDTCLYTLQQVLT